ncbi:ac117 [Lambdina fiscellaria nucleopolyhedrovirus]|uniref:Ac117 n=1 Tax=Lambdina fiscellaria nucleopolyhedrovirus TaxID=1642929 RepID=A0A0E3URA3_9ABAC|nr:ac117 [Lambdina fiscellaria nucleopolyhedrovirus]AKC91660.1 ac117 [Lambdina fiscellaria nucleopolyhedrovirus]
MNLTAFIVYFRNSENLSSQEMYSTRFVHFDVIDAMMCKNGQCLAVCVSAVDPLNNNPRCFNAYEAAFENNNDVILIKKGYEDLDELWEMMHDLINEYDYYLEL